jgi:pyruvate formate lyase activating enzyme
MNATPSLSPIGKIFNIQHFCTDDGPGIRTTVFFKGCPMRCAWCHNPESQSSKEELFLRLDRCRFCGACVQKCPQNAHTLTPAGEHLFDRDLCIACGACADACAFEALETVIREVTVEDVMRELLSDRVFYKHSGGGVTLSGGEPTAQPQFCEALLKACREEGLSTAMETCGYCSPDLLKTLTPLVDVFLFDWKLTDDTLHKRYTGVSNQRISENLRMLCEAGARVILRCPIIPTVNLDDGHMEGIAALANRYTAIERIDLEPYHPMGIGKCEALGHEVEFDLREFSDREAPERFADALRQRTETPVHLAGT